LYQGWALTRHEHHLIAVLAANAEMRESIAQSFTIYDPQSCDEIFLNIVIRVVGHIAFSFQLDESSEVPALTARGHAVSYIQTKILSLEMTAAPK